MAHTDTFFKFYERSNLNLIPVIENGEKKVYGLTGPQDNGVVIFGNDYLLIFDSINNLISQKRLHHDIIIHKISQDTSFHETKAFHNHLPSTGDFITATDICTLLLYERFTPWETYSVYSKNYVSVWDCKNNVLATISLDKSAKSKKGKHKKK